MRGRRAAAASRPALPTVLLDARVRVGGPTVYARNLVAGLREVGGCHPSVVGPGRAWPAFTPWGRARVAVEATRCDASLVHGLHVELPPGCRDAVVTVQDVIPLDCPPSVPSPAARLVYRRVLAASLRRAARVIVPSSATAGRLVGLGVAPDRIAVVPLGVGAGFRPSTADEREAARRRFAGGRRYVVASTGNRAHKNAAAMRRAAGLLPTDIVVAATGGAPGQAGSGIRFVGPLDDVELRAFYGGAEAMVLPALVEGFGLPAVEALACGVPVVCGAGTGALPHLRPGAIVVDVSRPAELAAGIRSLVDDDGLRAGLATAGAQATAHLTAAAMAAATLAVYERVLAETSR